MVLRSKYLSDKFRKQYQRIVDKDEHTDDLVDVMARERQYEAPIVFGMISESTRINRVRMAEMMPKYSSPKSFIDSAPTPAEPMV